MTNAEEEWYLLQEEIVRDYFTTVKDTGKYKLQKLRINPSMYKKALEDFMRYGAITVYPEKHIYRWKRYTLHNIAVLASFSEICGHTSHFPIETYNDIFHYDHNVEDIVGGVKDYEEFCFEFWDVYSEDICPTWSNGHWLVSDYGLPKLMVLGHLLVNEIDVNQILILINKILNVTHPRSDLAELFIIGGSDSLTMVSNN